MAFRIYAVYPGPERESVPFECKADSAVLAIGEYEKHLHARRQPREPLAVRAYRPVPEAGARPQRPPVASGVIEPAPFRVRFHAPEAYGEGDHLRVSFDVDGRETGELLEVEARYGSQWVASSPEPEFHGIGSGEPLMLREACREVERVAGRAREQWRDAPARETAGPGHADAMER